jgi:hypothetical protein
MKKLNQEIPAWLDEPLLSDLKADDKGCRAHIRRMQTDMRRRQRNGDHTTIIESDIDRMIDRYNYDRMMLLMDLAPDAEE